ncbi:hypothetical protein [Croceimicrobium sp.]|uniref:hypothetical protein n=1 Tax=Croceimicrobium sp. TaxID=2828340 RepID=UPI003BA994E9
MIFFDIEIYDGKPLKQVHLKEELPLLEQWRFLTEDILCIDYFINNLFEFSVDVGWHPTVQVTEDSYFKTEVIEGPITDGGVFYKKYSTTIVEMKEHLTEAIDLIQSFKGLNKEQIIKQQVFDEGGINE